MEYTKQYLSKLSVQDAKDFGGLSAHLEITIESLKDMLDTKGIYYIKDLDDETKELIKRRIKSLERALDLKEEIFNRLNYPTEL